MKTEQPHGEKGHINIYTRDHDAAITNYGQHDRVVAFLPQGDELYIRVDHLWKLGEPTDEQILTAARKDQDIKGRWVLDRADHWDDGSSTDYHFRRFVGNRYHISHPRTATATVETAQRAADYLFAYRHSTDFHEYRVLDMQTGKIYAPKNSDTHNAIELAETAQ